MYVLQFILVHALLNAPLFRAFHCMSIGRKKNQRAQIFLELETKYLVAGSLWVHISCGKICILPKQINTLGYAFCFRIFTHLELGTPFLFMKRHHTLSRGLAILLFILRKVGVV